MADCPSCGMQQPFLVPPAAQVPERENRSRLPGVELVVINLNDVLLNQWNTVYEGNIYGWKILNFSSQPTQLDVAMGKPGENGVGILDGTILGLGWRASELVPHVRKLLWRKTGSNENRTVTFAVAVVPGAIESINPVYLSGLSGAVATRNADADDDGAASLIGLVQNARNYALRGSTNDWARGITCDLVSAITGEAHDAQLYQRVASALLGRDSALNTLNAIEARLGSNGSLANAVMRLFSDSLVRGIDRSSSNNTRPVWVDVPSAVLSGVNHGTPQALYTIAVHTKDDADGAVVVTTGLSRHGTGSAVAPAGAGIVILSLDCRSQPLKNGWLQSTGGGDAVDIQVSRDNATWHTIAAGVAAPVAPGALALATALLMETVKPFRYIRVITGGASANTITAELSAQGG